VSGPPALDGRELVGSQWRAGVDSQIEGPQQGGQCVAGAGPLGVHRAPGCQQDPKCFPEALGPGTDEFGRGRSQDGSGGGDGIDRIGFALGVPGLPPRRSGLANGEALNLEQARQPCPVGARPLDRHQDVSGLGSAADLFHCPAHAWPGGGKCGGPDHRAGRGGQDRKRVGIGVCVHADDVCVLLCDDDHMLAPARSGLIGTSRKDHPEANL